LVASLYDRALIAANCMKKFSLNIKKSGL